MPSTIVTKDSRSGFHADYRADVAELVLTVEQA